VCNLLDHDSPLRLNALLAGRGAELIVAAADRLRKLLSARQPILAIGAGWPASLRRTIEHFAAQADVRVVALPEVYPQAAAPVLLNTLVQRRLRPGRLPVEKGVLLLDGAAALAIGECLRHARPMLRIPLAVHDRTRGQLHYLLVPLGMSVREVLKWLDIKADALVIRGGEMLRQIDLTPNAIVAGAELHLHLLPPETPPTCGPCMRCWWCAEHCVMGAEPAWLAEAAQQRDPELAQRAGADWCIECGICDCVCPSQLPLLAAIRKLKQA
jgi:electron transport complex protein RnfC